MLLLLCLGVQIQNEVCVCVLSAKRLGNSSGQGANPRHRRPKEATEATAGAGVFRGGRDKKEEDVWLLLVSVVEEG